MRKFINIVENSNAYILPRGTTLYHATDGRWDYSNIKSPAWFAPDEEMAQQYSAMFDHTEHKILQYETTAAHRLILVSDIEGMEDALEVGDLRPLAYSVGQDGYDGWIEIEDGEICEIMLCRNSGIVFRGTVE